MARRMQADTDAAHLVAWRKRAKLTLQALADDIGSSKQNLSNIENGRTRLSADMAAVVAKRLGITTEMLLSGPPTEEVALELDLLALFRGAAPAERLLILDMARSVVARGRQGRGAAHGAAPSEASGV